MDQSDGGRAGIFPSRAAPPQRTLEGKTDHPFGAVDNNRERDIESATTCHCILCSPPGADLTRRLITTRLILRQL
eukprot:9155701-Pyramimonas_sp.AAC.2